RYPVKTTRSIRTRQASWGLLRSLSSTAPLRIKSSRMTASISGFAPFHVRACTGREHAGASYDFPRRPDEGMGRRSGRILVGRSRGGGFRVGDGSQLVNGTDVVGRGP